MTREQLGKIAKALADPTRLQILEAIAARDQMSCGELVAKQGVTPATISHHLKILTEAGLIVCCRKGQFIYSRVVADTVKEFTRFLADLATAKKSSRTR